MPLADEQYKGGGFSGGDNFAVKKSGENFPLAKFSQRVTNNFTANPHAGEYCEFRHVQRCTRRRDKDVFVGNMQWLCDWNVPCEF